MTDPRNVEDVLREGWGRASRTTVTASAVLFLLSRGQKAAPSELMKSLGVDWSSLNPYAIGLFGVPVVTGLCFWSIWWARAFAQIHPTSSWHEKVVTKTNLKNVGGKSKTLACWSLFLYVFLPVTVLAALEGKFLNGTFSFSMSGGYSCLPERAPQECQSEGSGLAHFWPSRGLYDIWNTPYRYEGNLTYLPPWQAILWIMLGLGALVYAGSYFRLLTRRS